MSLNGFEITAIIPAYNEEQLIGRTIKGLKKVSCIDKVLVIDDGSTDQTADIAAMNGAHVLQLPVNMGKAKAMQTGYEATESPIIVYLDADLCESSQEALKLIEPICRGDADATIVRFNMTPNMGGFGFVKNLSKWGLILLTGRAIPSVLSGQRGFKRKILNKDFFQYPGFGIEFGMTVDLILQKANILEVDADMVHRTTGRDVKGFIHRFKQFLDILKVIIKKQIKSSFAKAKINYPGE